jgi:uroporphyrinogen III methyltransferase/synthase
MKAKGTVYLVGAGPGDPQLLTLRGAALLRRAEVVVYDALVNPEVLRLAPPSAERILRTKERFPTQEAVGALLVARARAGQCVVRLKGGDPYVFGRGGEEAEGLAAAGVPFEVVPGISSVMAVPNYAGVPLTHRAFSSSFTVFTGHEDPDKEGNHLDWDQLARVPGTKVVLMGAERIGQLAEEMRRRGVDEATPVAMVHWGTTGQQRTIAGTLADIAAQAARARIVAPAVIVMGGVVSLRDKLNWYERLPLFGQRVVVTRAREQAGEFVQLLQERGAEVLEVPCIKTAPPTKREPLIEAIAGLGCYDWVIFTSANGVTSFFEHFFLAFEDLRDVGAVRLAAVGPATAEKLKELHLKVDLTPKEYVASQIAKALSAEQSLESVRILLLRAEVANPELPKRLEDLGAIVDDVPCYRTVPETEDASGHAARLTESGADWITFTSGSTVENFHARFDLPSLKRRFPRLRLASIGPETSKALAALSLHPALEAKPHTAAGLVAALEHAKPQPH